MIHFMAAAFSSLTGSPVLMARVSRHPAHLVRVFTAAPAGLIREEFATTMGTSFGWGPLR
jgi:hypothetical protein